MTTSQLTAANVAPSRAQPAARFVHVHAAPGPNHRIDSPFMRDVLAGLSRPRKSIPCTWLYDHRGFELSEAITQVHAYYPTRCEVAILENCAPRIASAVGSGVTLVALGSGSCGKTRLLLAALPAPFAYVPVDISVEVLTDSARAMQEPDAAVGLLRRLGQALGRDSMLVVGVDSTQDRSLLMPAYNDALGTTAAFNRNLLVRINRELGGNFDPMAFEHEARFNGERRRVEMHLVCRSWATFEVSGRYFVFEPGESIHTGNSYKHAQTRFLSLAREAGWSPVDRWTDSPSAYGVHLLERSCS
jgi:L-histidine Nalpha-methyltransferase